MGGWPQPFRTMKRAGLRFAQSDGVVAESLRQHPHARSSRREEAQNSKASPRRGQETRPEFKPIQSGSTLVNLSQTKKISLAARRRARLGSAIIGRAGVLNVPFGTSEGVGLWLEKSNRIKVNPL